MNTKRISIGATIALTLIGIGIGIIIGIGISRSKIGAIGALQAKSYTLGLHLSKNSQLLQPGTLRAATLLQRDQLGLAHEGLLLGPETL